MGSLVRSFCAQFDFPFQRRIRSPELEINMWMYNMSLSVTGADEGPLPLILPSAVKSQAARLTVTLRDPRTIYPVEDNLKYATLGDSDEELEDDGEGTDRQSPTRLLWITIGLSRVSTVSFACFVRR
jgi:hypothetical protein